MGIVKDRIGETNINNQNYNMKLIKYNSFKDVIVEFDCGYQKQTNYGQFKNGQVYYPFHKFLYDKGYYGIGQHQYGKIGNLKSYSTWQNMFHRVYDSYNNKRNDSYINASICSNWHSFNVFDDWFRDNYYEINNETMCLDKDILIKNNTIYSAETCCFLPNFINLILCKRKIDRGDLPIGVQYSKNTKNKYRAKLSKYHKAYIIGYYKTPNEAFFAYKKEKEQYIKEVAEQYKTSIPEKVYNAMYNYKVEITD